MSYKTIKSISEAYTSMVTERVLNERYSMDDKPKTEKHGSEKITYYNVYYKNKKIGSVVKASGDNWTSGADFEGKDEYFSDDHRTPQDAYKALIQQKPHKKMR